MSNLYKDLAEVYEAMYHTFIDYQEEYNFYNKIIGQYQKRSVLEVGCGTGNLAKYFIETGFEYAGLDYSKEMIKLAKNKNPEGDFFNGDMRSFWLDSLIESIIVTGRTVSYLIENESVNLAFASFANNLPKGGLLCFDFIDANQFIPTIVQQKEVIHKAAFLGTTYVRKSLWSLNLVNGMDFKWEATFYKENGKELMEIGKDSSIIRTFTADEIEIFLSINGFEIKDLIERPSYAFPTYVVVAEKIRQE